MYDGDADEGELEIGQISAMIKEIKPAAKIIEEIIEEFNQVKKSLKILFSNRKK
jgi:enoyl-[acyl-carrier protein] reductase II